MDALTLPFLVVGFVVLVAGGEALVRGGSGLGRAFGLPPLVVGLTIVAFATSAPELAVSVDAALSDSPGLAVGNVVGSNITNVLVVLGLAALILPVAVARPLVRVDIPVMLGFSLLLLLFALDHRFGRIDGLVLLTLITVYLARAVTRARRTQAAPAPPASSGPGDPLDPSPAAASEDCAEALASPGRRGVLRDLGLVLLGVGLLVLGARLLVRSASDLAEAVGMSELVIGLTVVAIGTSLPEIATSVIGALRGERDLAIGNIVGSNIANIGIVMGATAAIAPDGVPVDDAALRLDLPVMIAVGVLLVPLVVTNLTVHRWEGVLLLTYYGLYITYLLLDSSGNGFRDAYAVTVVGVVVPLTAAVLLLLTGRELRAGWSGTETERAE